jgi:anti-repressor protein
VNELITVNYDNADRPTVSGRELHEALGVKTAYKDWFPRMCEYGFVENVDFCSKMSESTGGRPSIDHQLTINMAKELCMIQRTEKGKQCRQYFISIENAWNSPEAVMSRALKIADRKLLEAQDHVRALEMQIEADKPKTIFADAVSVSKTSILVGELAKLLKQNGIEIGQNRLFAWLREKGYLISRKGTDYNMPTQKSMELKLFEIKENTIAHSDGHTSITKTPKITGRGQVYFINLFLKGARHGCTANQS